MPASGSLFTDAARNEHTPRCCARRHRRQVCASTSWKQRAMNAGCSWCCKPLHFDGAFTARAAFLISATRRTWRPRCRMRARVRAFNSADTTALSHATPLPFCQHQLFQRLLTRHFCRVDRPALISGELPAMTLPRLLTIITAQAKMLHISSTSRGCFQDTCLLSVTERSRAGQTYFRR